jgi:DNA polymerase III subunit gamma/tau
MDKFIVSARKYRPQNFSTVVGQGHITTTLKNAIKNSQLAHAFLFCGPRGVGKTTCARILAKTINCENPSAEGEACNVCHSCVSFNEGTSLNIHELDAASNNSVDDIRTLVDQVRFAPQAGKYKVYIIDEVHMLSSSAFNAFLKTLEEPPPYAIFILATTEKHKILPTILSRCQIFDFKRITLIDTVEHLHDICTKEGIHADKAALQVIAQKSEGCMRDSLSILDKIVSFTNGELNYQNTLEHLNILDADYYFKLLECMQQQDLAGAMLMYDEINRKGFEGDSVMDGFAEFIRNLLVCKDERIAGLLEVVESFRTKYVATAAKTSPAYLVTALNVLNEAAISFKQARNKRLHVELAIIRLCYLQQAIQLASGEEGLTKKKVAESALAFRVQPIKELKIKEAAPSVAKRSPVTDTQPVIVRESDAPRLIIETAPKAEKRPVAPVDIIASPPVVGDTPSGQTSTKLSGLSKIRKQFASQQASSGAQSVKPLTIEALQEAWKGFALSLREEKNPAFQSFELANMSVKDDKSFIITTGNNLEQKFVEQERRKLSEYMQAFFRNRLLSFEIVITENSQPLDMGERTLSSKEQYQKIVEEYPLVAELREKLRMDLDYK